MVSRGQAYFISEEPLPAILCKEYLFYLQIWGVEVYFVISLRYKSAVVI